MRLITILILLLPVLAAAQPCSNNPGMSPSTAIPVCGTSSFTQNVVANCIGAQDIPNASVCPGTGVTSDDSFWYKFHCYQTGTLGFLINPMGSGDDYDWEVFDLTGHVPNDVYSFESMRVSLNLSAITGSTGCTNTGTLNVHCAGGSAGSQYNAMPTITAGKDYLLMVTNWSASGLGYRLNFVGGSAVITDPVPPSLLSTQTSCSATSIKLFFSKDIVCSSVTASGSEFTIMPGNITATSVSSQCAAGFNAITELTVNLAAPLASGNYQLVVNNGSDGNTFADVCGNRIAQGSQIAFTIASNAPGVISNINFTGCATTVLDLDLTNPVLCSTITANGSEFFITPGNPAIISVSSPDCAAGGIYTSKLRVQLQNPLPAGSYQLVLQNGTDGNTFVDTCAVPMQPASHPFVINPIAPPVISTIDFNECQPDKIVLNFDKPLSCNSVTATGSEFRVNPGNIAVSSIQSSCSPGGYTSQLTLTLASALPAGNFSVGINNGTDANTVADTCLSYIAAGYSKSFVTTQAPRPIFDSVVLDACNPAFVTAYYSKGLNCNTISADGSEYLITGPSAVAVVSAAPGPNCAQGYANWVSIQFSQPITVSGNYTLRNRQGSDGNGIIDTCNAAQNINETISFNAYSKPSPAFTSQVQWGCVNDTIVLSHPGGNGVNSWTWKFSDGTTASGQNVTHLFPVSTVTATVKLIVSNARCTDSVSVDITLDNAIKAGFTTNPTDTTCIGKDVSFTNSSTGNNLGFLWQFGDNSSFNGNTPPLHNYAASNSYTVLLIATNNHGCSDTARHSIVITALPTIDFGTLASRYCSGDNVVLSANLQGNISSYAWDNGDGKTFNDQPQVSFTYAAQNIYSVKLTATDRFCGNVDRIKTTQVYLAPNINLGNDTTFCPGLSTIIGVVNDPAYTYLWNSGETTSQITTGQTSRTYILTATNNGCVGQDNIAVKVLSTCLIKVPNAFTPNNDGLNDYLKAINADLAKQFSFFVYNRFGQRVFTSYNPLQGWDGKFKGVDSETGTYVWQLWYVDPISGKSVYEKGSSILIR